MVLHLKEGEAVRLRQGEAAVCRHLLPAGAAAEAEEGSSEQRRLPRLRLSVCSVAAAVAATRESRRPNLLGLYVPAAAGRRRFPERRNERVDGRCALWEEE